MYSQNTIIVNRSPEVVYYRKLRSKSGSKLPRGLLRRISTINKQYGWVQRSNGKKLWAKLGSTIPDTQMGWIAINGA
jgi:hypothetical protein